MAKAKRGKGKSPRLSKPLRAAKARKSSKGTMSFIELNEAFEKLGIKYFTELDEDSVDETTDESPEPQWDEEPLSASQEAMVEVLYHLSEKRAKTDQEVADTIEEACGLEVSAEFVELCRRGIRKRLLFEEDYGSGSAPGLSSAGESWFLLWNVQLQVGLLVVLGETIRAIFGFTFQGRNWLNKQNFDGDSPEIRDNLAYSIDTLANYAPDLIPRRVFFDHKVDVHGSLDVCPFKYVARGPKK